MRIPFLERGLVRCGVGAGRGDVQHHFGCALCDNAVDAEDGEVGFRGDEVIVCQIFDVVELEDLAAEDVTSDEVEDLVRPGLDSCFGLLAFRHCGGWSHGGIECYSVVL